MTAQRAAYLEALGIPVWVRKGQAAATSRPAAAGLRLGPGTGRFLLLCAGADETAGRLAADIARVLGEEPVWAWPAVEETGAAVESAVDEHLFTNLLVFGAETACQVFGASAPRTVNSARVLVVPGMAELAAEPGARAGLWRTLCDNRLVPDA